jgi:hypothetical protein
LGRPSDINFKEFFAQFYEKGAYFVMKNTSQLESEEFEEISLVNSSHENVEEQLIQEHLQQNKLFDRESEFLLTKSLLHALNTTKREGETSNDFQKRIEEETDKLLRLRE